MAELFRQYKQMFDSMAEGAFFQNADGTLTDVNRAALELFGLSFDQFTGRTSYHPEWRVVNEKGELLLPDQHPSMIALRTALQISNFVAGVYNPLRQKTVWLEITATPLFQEGATAPCQVFVTLTDITKLKQGEESLEKSELLFQQFFNLQLVGAAITSPAKGWLAVNDKLCSILGYTKDELCGMTWAELTHPEDLTADVTQFEQVMAGEIDGYTFEKRFIRKDGAIIWISFAAQCVRNQQGEVLYFASLAEDITERKENIEKLDYVHGCFTQALNGSQHILYRLNVRDGCYDYLSPAFEKITGYPVAEFKNTGLEQLKEFFHPVDRADIFKVIDNALLTRTGNTIPFDFEYRLRKADGSYCWLHDSTNACFNEHGELELFFGSAHDITERKRLELNLLESEDRYRRFIATANEGIGITDRDYRVTYANASLAEMLGYEMAELIGIAVVELLPPEDRSAFAALISERTRGVSSQRECRHLRKDGSICWLQTSSTPILTDEGTFQGTFAMFTDLSRRKEAETALQKAHNDLETRVAERTAELAAANTQIRMMTFELVRAQEQERIRIAAELHDQVGQSLLLAKMKLDMLASGMSTIGADSLAADISAQLDNCIQDIRTLTFGMRPPLLDSAGIEAALQWLCTTLLSTHRLKVDYSSSCPTIQFNRETRYSLYQAVRELLLNVAKHAGIDQAELSLRTVGNDLFVRVADGGTGFEPTARLNRLDSGSGFGLYNVQQRLEHLGGSFTLDSQPGQGTVVTLTIPMESDVCS